MSAFSTVTSAPVLIVPVVPLIVVAGTIDVRAVYVAHHLRHPGAASQDQGSTLSEHEVAFGRLADRYKRENRHPFLALTEVIDLLESLGWRLTAAAGPLRHAGSLPPLVARVPPGVPDAVRARTRRQIAADRAASGLCPRCGGVLGCAGCG